MEQQDWVLILKLLNSLNFSNLADDNFEMEVSSYISLVKKVKKEIRELNDKSQISV